MGGMREEAGRMPYEFQSQNFTKRQRKFAGPLPLRSSVRAAKKTVSRWPPSSPKNEKLADDGIKGLGLDCRRDHVESAEPPT